MEDIIPKKVRKPSTKPKTKPAEEGSSKPTSKKTTKKRAPSPEESFEEEPSVQSIPSEVEGDVSLDSIQEESSIEEIPAKKAKTSRGTKSSTTKPQVQITQRARSTSAQPSSRAKTTPASTTKGSGVKGRKPKLEVVPETQVDMSVVEEEDEVDEIDFAPRPRQSSVLSNSVMGGTRPAAAFKKDRIKELQTQAEKNFAMYKERAEKRFKGIAFSLKELTV